MVEVYEPHKWTRKERELGYKLTYRIGFCGEKCANRGRGCESCFRKSNLAPYPVVDYGETP